MWKIAFCVIISYLFIVSSQNVEHEKLDKKANKQVACGQNVTTPIGSFHLAITNLTDKVCNWTITPHSKTSKLPVEIRLFIHSLFLHEKDVVRIFKNEADSKNETLAIVDPIHAQNGSVTVITNETSLFITLTGTDTAYIRNFEGLYVSESCTIAVPPNVQIMHSPIYTKDISEIKCTYMFNEVGHHRFVPVFTFEEFNFNTSEVSLSASSHDGLYKNDPPMDFFPTKYPMHIDIQMQTPTHEYYRLAINDADSECSGYRKIDSHDTSFTFESPREVLNNGSITVGCRWVFELPDHSQIFGLNLWKFHFENTLDIVAVNDGPSAISPPLLQITASTANLTNNQIVRSTGPYLWVAFQPKTYASMFVANVTAHGQGGHFKGNGTIQVKPTDGNDTVFLLEVTENEVVLLNFTAADFDMPATLSIYDGFDKTNLLATLHGKVWYPVLSKSKRMMIIATSFSKGSFTANFKGVSPGCVHMSTFSNENYILSGNCNNTCQWIIPPQDRPGSVLLLNLQFLSLGKDDHLSITQLDDAKTLIGNVFSNVSHVPQMMIPANIGALVEINRGPCEKEDVVLVGHSSYLPVCGKDLSLDPATEFQITSPLYPDTYPVLASCKWNLKTAKENLVHLAFHSIKLAPNHCIKVTHLKENKTTQYDGSKLPEDLFLSGDSVVEFDSTNCKTTKVAQSLVSAEGFVLNGTVASCGGQLSGKANGNFSTQNHTLCIWKVSIPESSADVVNIISYSVSKKDEVGNYELHVYDGNSVRESRIINNTKSEIWSRTNELIFVYKRINVAKPSTVVSVKYSTINCNNTMQCDNKICLHPDWRCNGVNDCGDFSDERNCESVPIPPVVKEFGYTATAFWVTIFVMLVIGAVLGVGIPLAYQKFKSGQYRRFDDISAIH